MIYLVRHGLDDETFIGGWSDVDLTSTGIKQVENTRDYIVDNNLLINNIISSDVKRAKTTSHIINEKLNVDIILDKNLRELDKGTYTGIKKILLSDKELNSISNYEIYDRYPNGESMYDLYERIKKLLEKIKDKDNTLIVTHRGVINMIYYILNEISLDMNKERFNVTHASLHELDINKKLIRRIY